LINGLSAAFQFVLLPPILKRVEPALLWRIMPFFSLLACLSLQVLGHEAANLTLLAAAFSTAKILDYSLRSVVYIMVYQPLDYESRYMGKEIVGVFASRFGKSWMSLLLSGLSVGGWAGLPQLLQFSLGTNVAWLSSTWWLSSLLPSKAEAQAIVEERQQQGRKQEKEQQQQLRGDENDKEE
jgi:ATP/ADP translocase